MAMRIFLAMRIDAYFGYIWHMSDIAQYYRIMRKLMRISASAWPSLLGMPSQDYCFEWWPGNCLICRHGPNQVHDSFPQSIPLQSPWAFVSPRRHAKFLNGISRNCFGANEWTFGSAVFWWLIFFNEAIFRVPPGPSQYGKSIFSPLAINKYIGEVVLSLHSS